MQNIVVAFPILGILGATYGRTLPLLGPSLPAPSHLSQDAMFQAAVSEIGSGLDSRSLHASYKETTFSVGLFSTFQDNLVWQHHYTSPQIAKSPHGSRRADADSIYRIGSTSKLYLVYLLLAELGDEVFSHPVTRYVPELEDLDESIFDYPTPQWRDILVGDIAGQMAGLGRDCSRQLFPSVELILTRPRCRYGHCST